MRAWWTGGCLLAAGLGWWIADRVLTSQFPLSWGGPNIGGGFLLLVALVTGVAGFVTLINAAPEVRSQRPAAWIVWTPLVVNACLAAALVAVRLLLPGDTRPDGGMAGVNGQVGVSVDAAGSPVLVLEVCRGSVDTIEVVGPNRGDAPNEVFARLAAPAPVHAPIDVALLAPPRGWDGAPASLPLDSQEFLIASASGRQSELLQVDFSAGDLAALDPATVQYSDYDGDSGDLVDRRAARSAFHDLACPH